MKNYHAHIYFPQDAIADAEMLYGNALKNPDFSYCKIHTKPIGPHPTGMIEVHFKENQLASVRSWLINNRKTFSTLIHIDTGDDVKDHSEDIEWLGTPVKIDFDFFELIKTKPDLKVHQD